MHESCVSLPAWIPMWKNRFSFHVVHLVSSVLSVIKHNNKVSPSIMIQRQNIIIGSIWMDRIQNAETSVYKLPLSYVFPFFQHSLSYWHGFNLFTRLRKELEIYKEGQLKLLREALNSEIQFLKSVSLCVMNNAFIHILLESDTITCIPEK